MELKRSLEEIGLTVAEAKVYETLLKAGQMMTGQLSNKSGVRTSNIYPVLEKLIEKGLVSYSITSNAKQFRAEGINHLKDYFKMQQEKLKIQEQELLQFIPTLARMDNSNESPEVAIYKGINGIKSAQETVLNTLAKNDTFYVIATSRQANEKLMPYFNHFHQRRAEKGIKYKVIYGKKLSDFAFERKNYALTFVKILSHGIETPATTWIFGEYVVLANFDQSPFVIKIKNNAIAATFREYFDLLWKNKE